VCTQIDARRSGEEANGQGENRIKGGITNSRNLTSERTLPLGGKKGCGSIVDTIKLTSQCAHAHHLTNFPFGGVGCENLPISNILQLNQVIADGNSRGGVSSSRSPRYPFTKLQYICGLECQGHPCEARTVRRDRSALSACTVLRLDSLTCEKHQKGNPNASKPNLDSISDHWHFAI
jgi:hypothetical protein